MRVVAKARGGENFVGLDHVDQMVRRLGERGRVRLKTLCTVGDRPVVEGEALVMVPSRAARAAARAAGVAKIAAIG